MTAFDLAWAKTGRAEGGYSDHPDDPGGKTMYGITERVARAQGYTGDMRQLPKDTATAIAKKEYWDRLRLDDVALLSVPVALELFDTNLNLWYGAAGKFLQRALNALNHDGRDYGELVADGNIGPRTLAALRAFLDKRDDAGEKVLLACLNGQQLCDYLRQTTESPGKESFFYGWVLHRVVA